MTLSRRAWAVRERRPPRSRMLINLDPSGEDGGLPGAPGRVSLQIVSPQTPRLTAHGGASGALASRVHECPHDRYAGHDPGSHMEVHMSDDHSPGDARKRYADIGGPEARHAQTHDVAREKATNPKGPEPVDESFDQQLAEQTPAQVRQQHLEADAGDTDKKVGKLLPELTDDQL